MWNRYSRQTAGCPFIVNQAEKNKLCFNAHVLKIECIGILNLFNVGNKII